MSEGAPRLPCAIDARWRTRPDALLGIGIQSHVYLEAKPRGRKGGEGLGVRGEGVKGEGCALGLR
ncbi:hypothetical protein E2C01_073413 [Portunus trituberculatus]|uniref:Uncharacterized protein n=1 Tax=Portunus trituberculatus TaxID=210409 RepID=A0A5B7IBM3_PORTR|nr:hypothetical protein [Portunus trituberculatus]